MLRRAEPRASPTSTSSRSTRRSRRRCCARSRPGRIRSTTGTSSAATTPLGAIDPDKINVKGSSLAYGHPFAATGARILGLTAKLLNDRAEAPGADLGLHGRRQGVAALVERAPRSATTAQRLPTIDRASPSLTQTSCFCLSRRKSGDTVQLLDRQENFLPVKHHTRGRSIPGDHQETKTGDGTRMKITQVLKAVAIAGALAL